VDNQKESLNMIRVCERTAVSAYIIFFSRCFKL